MTTEYQTYLTLFDREYKALEWLFQSSDKGDYIPAARGGAHAIAGGYLEREGYIKRRENGAHWTITTKGRLFVQDHYSGRGFGPAMLHVSPHPQKLLAVVIGLEKEPWQTLDYVYARRGWTELSGSPHVSLLKMCGLIAPEPSPGRRYIASFALQVACNAFSSGRLPLRGQAVSNRPVVIDSEEELTPEAFEKTIAEPEPGAEESAPPEKRPLPKLTNTQKHVLLALSSANLAHDWARAKHIKEHTQEGGPRSNHGRVAKELVKLGCASINGHPPRYKISLLGERYLAETSDAPLEPVARKSTAKPAEKKSADIPREDLTPGTTPSSVPAVLDAARFTAALQAEASAFAGTARIFFDLDLLSEEASDKIPFGPMEEWPQKVLEAVMARAIERYSSAS